MEFYTFSKRSKKDILYRGVKNGKRISKVIKSHEYKPSLFVKSPDGEHSSIFGDRLREVNFQSIAKASAFVYEMEAAHTPVFGMTQFNYSLISDLFPNNIQYDKSMIRTFFIDIETYIGREGFEKPETARQPITAIALYDSFDDVIYSFSWKKDTKAPKHKSEKVKILFFENEVDMLSDFIFYWKTRYCDIVSGWNSELYDIPYLTQRIKRVMGEDVMQTLSPFGMVRERMIEVNGREQLKVDIVGITSLDYLDVYKKFTYSSQESYKLDYIASVEIGEKKISYTDEYTDLNDLYNRNFELYIEYNIRDVELLLRMDDKKKFMDIVFELTYSAKCNFEDSLGTVRIWDVYIYNQVKKKGLVIPPDKISQKDSAFTGAFVKSPIRGLHDWVVTFDAASLYPSLIRQYNMSPETLVPYNSPIRNLTSISLYNLEMDKLVNAEYDFSELLNHHNVGITASGALFYNDIEGAIPPIVASVLDERKIAKGIMLQKEQELENETDEAKRAILKNEITALNGKQMALKILNNSLDQSIWGMCL